MTTTHAAADIIRLEAIALDAAQELAMALQSLSDAYWVEPTADAPLFRCMQSTVDTLEEIENMLLLPANEIKCAI